MVNLGRMQPIAVMGAPDPAYVAQKDRVERRRKAGTVARMWERRAKQVTKM